MVRMKTRWILVRVESGNQDMNIGTCALGKKELSHAIRNHLIQCAGIAATGMADDTQVRFYDSSIRLALIRVPRDVCSTIRASITLLSEIQKQHVVVSILSVNGSARTAKVSAIRHVRFFYREILQSAILSASSEKHTNSQKDLNKLCNSMEETLETIGNIDY